MSNTYKIEIFKDKESLAINATEILLNIIESELSKKSRIQIALSGGSTPSSVYRLLSLKAIQWERVDVFLGDERWVPHEDESSNALMIRNTLLSNPPGSLACFHEIPTTEFPTPEKSADAFEKILKEKCNGNPPVFDLMLLGLGDDGHTASLFPSTDSLKVTDKFTTIGKGKGKERITLTSPVLSSAKNIVFLVSGASKKNALSKLIDPSENSEHVPAKLVKSSKEILVLTDEPAAVLINK
tara:strand:+ start:5544 stop:6266 length:723 start_codon:yes stop_codon:yes gene_type:complete